MKQTLQKLYAVPFVSKVFEWSKLLTITGFSQAVVQLMAFVSGIVVIRLLPTNEYALYVLANTMVGTMAVLADGGISTGVTSQGGLVWKDRERLGIVLATGLDLRKKFAVGSLLVATPVMIVLLTSHGATIWTTVLIVLAIVPVFFSTLSGSLLQIAPKLQQDILPLQKNQITFNLIRLVGLTFSLTFFPFAFLALVAAGIAQVWSNLNLKKISARYADWSQDPDPRIRRVILRFVTRLLPGSIYFCISGQLAIWLISILGSTASIAQVGALTRLAVVLTFFSILINVLIVPRFVRIVEDRKVILSYYIKIQLLLFLISAIFVSMSSLFADQILWVLGESYAHLEDELVLCTIGSCLNLAVGINYILNSSRGWLLHPLIGISTGIAGTICGVLLIDISTLQGVLIFNIFTGVVGLFIHPLYGFLKIASLKTGLINS